MSADKAEVEQAVVLCLPMRDEQSTCLVTFSLPKNKTKRSKMKFGLLIIIVLFSLSAADDNNYDDDAG